MRSEPIKGRVRASVIGVALGRARTGTQQLVIRLKIGYRQRALSADGRELDVGGWIVTLYQFLTDSCVARTVENLRHCGWHGERVSDLVRDPVASGVYDRDVVLTLGIVDGFTRVTWVAPLFDAQPAPVDDDELAALDRLVAGAAGGGAPGRAPAPGAAGAAKGGAPDRAPAPGAAGAAGGGAPGRAPDRAPAPAARAGRAPKVGGPPRGFSSWEEWISRCMDHTALVDTAGRLPVDLRQAAELRHVGIELQQAVDPDQAAAAERWIGKRWPDHWVEEARQMIADKVAQF